MGLSNGVSRNELFTSFDSSFPFETDKSKWDYEYYTNSVRVELKANFCEKCTNHAKDVVIYLRTNNKILKYKGNKIIIPYTL